MKAGDEFNEYSRELGDRGLGLIKAHEIMKINFGLRSVITDATWRKKTGKNVSLVTALVGDR